MGRFFHQMSGRPDDNVAAATFAITVKTIDLPAAPTINSTGQRDKQDTDIFLMRGFICKFNIYCTKGCC